MKKFLPVVFFVLGLLVLAGVYFFVIRDRGEEAVEDEDEVVAEIPLEMRPVASLTPNEDGHWLKMVIKGIKLDAYSMDYELLYKVEDGRTQGVPGTVKLDGKSDLERDLLLGSESSGKFRYDEGVEEGTLTLRFRNEKGKLVGKLSTDWHLQNGTDELSSVDGSFKYTLDKEVDAFFVAMETFGLPGDAPGSIASGPYGVFSEDTDYSGVVSMSGSESYLWSGTSWEKLDSGESSEIGIFVGI